MKIKMLTPYDDGTLVLAKGSDGEGLTDRQKKRFVRVGLAEKVDSTAGVTTARKSRKKAPAAEGSAAPKRAPARKRNTETALANAPAPAGQVKAE